MVLAKIFRNGEDLTDGKGNRLSIYHGTEQPRKGWLWLQP